MRAEAALPRNRFCLRTASIRGESLNGLQDGGGLPSEEVRLRVDVRCALAAILQLAEGARNGERLGGVAEAFVSQIKMDAGTRNRRFQYITLAI
jgi:hypothetical protein